tara:strand:- start:326 stop:862 length:537 start_codon:yes stop_codon:yes gene_type:complete
MKTIQVAADGECLFNSIAYGMLYYKFNRTQPLFENYKRLASILRRGVVAKFNNYIHKGDAEYTAILANEYSNIVGYDFHDIIDKADKYAQKYSNYMANKTSWGGLLEINALTNYIHKQGFKGIQIYDSDYKKVPGMRTEMNPTGKHIIKVVLSTTKSRDGRLQGIHFDFCVNCLTFSN